MIIRFFIVYVCLFILSIHSVMANSLIIDDVLKTTAEFYPDILANIQKIEASKTQIQKAQGAFDTVLSQDLYTRPDGYYDGNYFDTRLEQPIPEMNAKFYTGYRVADGIFPIYENERETLNRGEYYIGTKLSLLRDRVINKKITNISVAELKVVEEQTNLMLQKLEIQKNAIQKYWSWVMAGHQHNVYRKLLKLAEIRQENLKQQVDHGNIAAIYLQENQQYLLKRQADLNIAKTIVDMMAQELSLYYRDKNGEQIIPDVGMLPKDIPNFLNHRVSDTLFRDISLHPIFKILSTQKSILNQKKLLSENDLLPYLDFNLKLSQDIGHGSKNLNEGEIIMFLNMTVPLNRTVAKSDKAYAEAKIQELSYKEQMQLDKLRTAIKKLLINMDNQKKFLIVTQQEYQIAKKMLHVEEERFQEGISDFFTLNKREEDMMKIRLQQIKAKENYLKMQAEIRTLTASLEPVFENIDVFYN